MPPPAVTTVNADGTSPYVLLCEHASNFIPERYSGLGLSDANLQRHIAWDPGAAPVARHLSALLDAPLFLSGYSRLLIDCNRPLGTPTSIPVRSEATDIPGNVGLDDTERAARAAAYFAPFHDAVAACLDRRKTAGQPAIVLGIHSFTPVFLGVARPWHAGVLFARAERLGTALVARLGASDAALVAGHGAGRALNVAANEPYRIEPDHDYTVPVHGDGRGNEAALIELRQDLLRTPAEQRAWAERLAAALADLGP